MSTSSKTKQLAVDTILFGISTFGSKILVFLLTPLYTAVLLTEEYGVADLINTTVNLIYPVLTLAIADATLRYSLDKNCSKRAVLGDAIVITIASLLLLISFYPVINMMNSEITVQLSAYWGYFVATYGHCEVEASQHRAA
jgi:O-antigen/teichoic acid export membrane protein